MTDWRVYLGALAFVAFLARSKEVNHRAMRFGGLLVLALAGYKTLPLIATSLAPVEVPQPRMVSVDTMLEGLDFQTRSPSSRGPGARGGVFSGGDRSGVIDLTFSAPDAPTVTAVMISDTSGYATTLAFSGSAGDSISYTVFEFDSLRGTGWNLVTPDTQSYGVADVLRSDTIFTFTANDTFKVRALHHGMASSLSSSYSVVDTFVASVALPTITYASRDIGSKAGGTVLFFTGTELSTSTTLTLGDTAATVDSASATNDTVWITTARRATAAGYDTVNVIACNSGLCDTLAAGYEYADTATVEWFHETFEDSALTSPLTTNGTVTFPTDGNPVGGTRVAEMSSSGNGVSSNLLYVDDADPIGVATGPRGIFMRWYMRLDSAAIVDLRAGQVKFHINRQDAGNNWGVLISGTEAAWSWEADEIRYIEDAGGNCWTGESCRSAEARVFDWVADEWAEFQIQNYRDTINSLGWVRAWINGKEVLADSSSSAGNDVTTTTSRQKFGIETRQNTGGTTMLLWIDNLTGRNQYIDPGE